MKKNKNKSSQGVDNSRPATYSVPMSYEDLSADELAELDAAIAAETADALEQFISEQDEKDLDN